MSAASVSIDRSGMAGSPAPIVIADDGETYRLTEGGVGYVLDSVRVTTMPDSASVHGEEDTAFALEATALPVEFHIFADSSAELEAARLELAQALFRIDFPVTRTVDGVSQTYSATASALRPVRGAVDAYVQAAFFDTFSAVIRIPYPVAS